MTSEASQASPDTMTQLADTTGSMEQLSPEGSSTERTPTEDAGEDTTMETGEEEDGAIGRAEGDSPSPAAEPATSSAEEGKPEGGKKKSRLRQGFINFKRKLFPRKKGSKLKEDNKHGSQKSKSASNVLEEVEEDPTKMERAMSVDSVYPTDQRTNPSHGMKDARSLETIHLAALQSRLKNRLPRDDEDRSATDMMQPYGGSNQSLGSMNSLEDEAMEDFFQTNWTTGNTKRPVSPEPKIHDLDMVSGAKLLDNKEARQKINVKPKKTRPASRHTRTRTVSPLQKSTSSLPQVIEEPQSMEPAKDKTAVTVTAAEKVTPVMEKDTPEEAPRPVLAASKKDTHPEVVISPVKEVAKEETPKPKEEPMERKKEMDAVVKTPVEPKPKPKQCDELRVTQVRRVPSERIGKAVHLRENNGTPESKVKRRMVSSDGSSLEVLHTAQHTSLEQPFGWLAGRKMKEKTAETGSKTSLNPKVTKEDDQTNIKVQRVPSERKTQDVKLREKSDAPEDKTRQRISSEGGSVEECKSPRPTSMQEPLGQPVVKKEDTSPSQKKDDVSTSGCNTEFSQMFYKMKQKSQKKVKVTDEKENIVLKTAPKESNVVMSPQKPPLTDAHSKVSGTEDPADVSAAPKQKTVFVIEKSEPKSSNLEPPPVENAVSRRSSPLLKDRMRRQTLPVSPSQVNVLSPEKEGDASKVKRSVSQRKQTEPATSTPLSSSAGSGLLRAATVVPKKPPSEETSSSTPPWAAMALKKTSKFEQNMKLKASSEVLSSESVKSADVKPDSATEPAVSVAKSVSDTGSTNTVLASNAATKPAVLIIASNPTVSNPVTSTVSSTTTKPALSSLPTKPALLISPAKPAVSSMTSKPAVLIIPAKPVASSMTTKPVVSSTTTKPVVSSTTTKSDVSSMTTKPVVSNITTKPTISPTKLSVGALKTPGSTTVFAPSLKSRPPTSNVVDTNKSNDETKGSETILSPDRKENYSGNRKSRVLDMVKNWQNSQVADV